MHPCDVSTTSSWRVPQEVKPSSFKVSHRTPACRGWSPERRPCVARWGDVGNARCTLRNGVNCTTRQSTGKKMLPFPWIVVTERLKSWWPTRLAKIRSSLSTGVVSGFRNNFLPSFYHVIVSVLLAWLGDNSVEKSPSWEATCRSKFFWNPEVLSPALSTKPLHWALSSPITFRSILMLC
jgi:hypothetical protein